MYNNAIKKTLEMLKSDLGTTYPEIFRLGMDLVKQFNYTDIYEKRGNSPMIQGVLNAFAFALKKALETDNNKLDINFLKELHEKTAINTSMVSSEIGSLSGGDCSLSINNCDQQGIIELKEFNKQCEYKILNEESCLDRDYFYPGYMPTIPVPNAIFMVLKLVFANQKITKLLPPDHVKLIKKWLSIASGLMEALYKNVEPFILKDEKEDEEVIKDLLRSFINLFNQKNLEMIQQCSSTVRCMSLVLRLSDNALLEASYPKGKSLNNQYGINLIGVYKGAVELFKETLMKKNCGLIKDNIYKEITDQVLDFMSLPTINKLFALCEDYFREDQVYNFCETMVPHLLRFGVGGPYSSSNDDTNDLIQMVIYEYNSDIDTCCTEQARLKLIIKTTSRLEQIHPFKDHNCRTICIVLFNYLLLINNLPPAKQTWKKLPEALA